MKIFFVIIVFLSSSVWANTNRTLRSNQEIFCDFNHLPITIVELNEQNGTILLHSYGPPETMRLLKADPLLLKNNYEVGFFDKIDLSDYDAYTITNGRDGFAKDIFFSKQMLDSSNIINNEELSFEGHFTFFTKGFCFPGSGCEPERWILSWLSCRYKSN